MYCVLHINLKLDDMKMDKKNLDDLKKQKVDETVESQNLEEKQNKEKNYHLLKKIFIENNDSNFSFIKKHQNHYFFYTTVKAFIAFGHAWFLIGLKCFLNYHHDYLITNQPVMNNLQAWIDYVERTISIINILIPIYILWSLIVIFNNYNPFIHIKSLAMALPYHKFKKKKYSHYLLDMYQKDYITKYNMIAIIDMLTNYHPSYKKDLDILENMVKNGLVYNINTLCPTIKEKSEYFEKHESIKSFASDRYHSRWKNKFDEQETIFNKILMNIPEIQLSNYKDIQRYKPLTDRNMIEMIMEKQDIMKMNKKDITKHFQEILDENDRKLSELLSTINS